LDVTFSIITFCFFVMLSFLLAKSLFQFPTFVKWHAGLSLRPGGTTTHTGLWCGDWVTRASTHRQWKRQGDGSLIAMGTVTGQWSVGWGAGGTSHIHSQLTGASLGVQWLRRHTRNAGSPGVTPGQLTRPHTLQLKILQLRSTTKT